MRPVGWPSWFGSPRSDRPWRRANRMAGSRCQPLQTCAPPIFSQIPCRGLDFLSAIPSKLGFQIVSRAAEFVNLCSAGCSFSARTTTNLAGQDGEPSLIQRVLCCWSRIFCYLRRWCCLCFPISSHRSSFRDIFAQWHRSGDCPGGCRRRARLQIQPFVRAGCRAWMWVAIVLFLMVSPVLTVLAVGPINLSWDLSGCSAPGTVRPCECSVVAGWQEDFVKFMRYSRNPEAHYYFLLDWPAALSGPRAFVLDYHLMQAYRNNGYYSKTFRIAMNFFVLMPIFWCWTRRTQTRWMLTITTRQTCEKPNWFDVNIRSTPQFEWKVIASFDAPEVREG